MTKIISLLLAIMMVFMVGCEYLAVPAGNESDGGITYINLSELISNAKDNQTVQEVAQDVSDKKTETPVATEEETETTVVEIPSLKVTEGDLVSFPNLAATDPDGDKISYSFSSPLNEKGEWLTKVGDAGEKTVTITASDGKNKISQEVRIIIAALNKAPVMEKMDNIIIDEGKTLKLEPKVTDPEGKVITIIYSGFMTKDTKELGYDASGEYIVKITASDGVNEVSQDVKITVRDINRAPTFTKII